MKTLRHSLIFTLFAALTMFGCSEEEDVAPDTMLEITVTDNLGNSAPGTTVKLYATSEDLENAKNQIGTSQVSDAKGKVLFKGLQGMQYFWLAEKGCNSNIFGSSTTVQPIAANKSTGVTTVLSSTGSITFTNNSTNPYQVFLNGTLAFTAAGNRSYDFTVKTGSYSIRVLQVSGYAVYPTDITYTGTVTCGNKLNAVFPN